MARVAHWSFTTVAVFRRNDVAPQKKLCPKIPTVIVHLTKFQDRDKDKDSMNGKNEQITENGKRDDA
jgi:hypothetical protein